MKRRWKFSKKWLFLAAPLLICGWVRSQQPAQPVGTYPPGDINGDGQVTITDARLALQLALGLIQPSDIQRPGLPNGPATQEQILHGRYLMLAADCSGCHNGGGDPNSPLWLAGAVAGKPGSSFAIGPFTTYAANLTPDPTTGIGKWSATDIVNTIRTGKDPQGHYLCPPMPWPSVRNFSDHDLYDIAAYLKSIKPVVNAVPANQGPAKYPDGTADWSSSYTNVPPPPGFIPYPGKNETP